MQVPAPTRRRVGTLKTRLHAIIGFLGLLPVLGAAFALFAVVNLTRDNTALDLASSGTIHLERINRLVHAAVMESRGIYLSPDWVTAEPFATNLLRDLSSLRETAQAWQAEPIESQRGNIDELALRIKEFIRLRTELVRMSKEDGTAAARAFGDNEANAKIRNGLNDSLITLTRAYELESSRVRATVETDQYWFLVVLSGLAVIAFIALCGGIVLVRTGLLGPLLRVRQSMLRLALGDLETQPEARQRTTEIIEMEQAIGVFRAGLVERSQLTRESQLLSELNEWLQSCNSLGELYDMVAQFLSRLLPGCAGSLYIYANSRDVLEGAKSWNGGSVQPSMHPEDCWGLRRGHVYSFGEREIDFPCGHVGSAKVEHYCCIPVLAHGETIGLLHLEFRASDDGSVHQEAIDEQRRLGLNCAEQISLAIANVKLRDQLRDQSIRDPLTGLFNRRYMLETCRREFSRAARAKQSVSMLSIDVDFFKKFNDNHGHDAGDTVLREVGSCLEAVFRNEDVACRFGGEEFVVVLPGAALEIGARRAEELRAKIEALSVRYLDSNLPCITISVGVASFPEAGDNPQSVLKAADDALYCAKEAGRNRVELATSGRQPTRRKDGPAGTRAGSGSAETSSVVHLADIGKNTAE